MDQTDIKILQELQTNGRITMTELGKKVALTAPAAAERVRKLEDRGVIEKYSISIDPEKVHKPISAYILFDTERCEAFVEFCRHYPDVTECNRLAGQFSYLVKITTSTVGEIETFINNTMKFGKSTTLMVLSTPIKQRPFPLDYMVVKDF
jgi:Lrp/AsnC family transcriptional regulator, leucine-responsive regulatory protein